MISIEVIGLIETVMKLATRKSELDKEYFGQFIQPLWETFAKVHEDYKHSLKQYTDLIRKDECEIQALIERIRQDSIYTADLRSELSSLVNSLPATDLGTKEGHLSEFIQSIGNYFDIRNSFKVVLDREHEAYEVYYDDSRPEYMYFLNVARFPLIVYLSRRAYYSTRDELAGTLNMLVAFLQWRYEDVAHTYNRLRTALLTT